MKLQEIAQLILKTHNVDLNSLKSKYKNKKFVQARIEFIRIALAHNKSASEIARFLDKDHTTIIHHKYRNKDAWSKWQQLEMDL